MGSWESGAWHVSVHCIVHEFLNQDYLVRCHGLNLYHGDNSGYLLLIYPENAQISVFPKLHSTNIQDC